jgi:type I restriction enzyme M protein
MPRALANIRTIQSGSHTSVREIANLVTATVDILRWAGPGKQWRLVEGQGIRAVEGTVIPGFPSHAWQIAERKSRFLYVLQDGDIIVGLVRPERRNIGLLLVDGTDIVGAPDGIAVVRVKPHFRREYPQEWLFAALRSEACRLQFWTESGGTSYGKLTDDNILNALIPIPPKTTRLAVADNVRNWAEAVRATISAWESIGAPEDRFPVVNSPSFGLVELTPGSELAGDEE